MNEILRQVYIAESSLDHLHINLLQRRSSKLLEFEEGNRSLRVNSFSGSGSGSIVMHLLGLTTPYGLYTVESGTDSLFLLTAVRTRTIELILLIEDCHRIPLSLAGGKCSATAKRARRLPFEATHRYEIHLIASMLLDDKVCKAGMPSRDCPFQSYKSLSRNEMIPVAPTSGSWCGNRDPPAAI